MLADQALNPQLSSQQVQVPTLNQENTGLNLGLPHLRWVS